MYKEIPENLVEGDMQCCDEGVLFMSATQKFTCRFLCRFTKVPQPGAALVTPHNDLVFFPILGAIGF